MKVYELDWERGHLIDENEDCTVLTFDKLEEFRFQLGGILKYYFSEKVILQGNFSVIPNMSDFPVVDIGLPLMSKRMLSILEADKTLQFNKYNTVIVDDTYLETLFDEKGHLIENVPKNTDYMFFQVLNYTNAFDRNHSSFKQMRSNTEKIGIIKKLVLREPSEGFPAIFRIEEQPSTLFINEITKNKFENSKIKGCSFKEIDTNRETK